MPDLKKILTLEALSAALPSWLKRDTKPEYNADEIDSANTTNQFVSASDKDNWNAKGTYSKPFGGIPKSDLSSIVQTSLEKADSALQSETDPTVPSWAKQPNKPSYTQDEVADGSTYKRVTQTEKDAWSGKQNALSTTQMQAVNSGINSTKVAQIETNKDDISLLQDATEELVDKGAKNKLDLSNATITVGSGLTLTRDGDAYVVSGTLSSQSQIVFTNFPPVTGDDLILSGCPYNGSTAGYGIWAYNGSTRVIIDDGSDIKTPYSGEITQIKFNFTAGNYSNIKFYPMICTLADWKISQNHAPFALPNTDLTVLEAEDRAALAEVVDSGAKNIVDISKAYASDYGNVSIDTNTNSVTASGTHAWAKGNIVVSVKPNTTYAIKYRISANTSTVQSSLTVTKGNTSDTYYSHIIASGTTGTFTGEFTTDANASIAVVKITANSTGSEIATAASITISELMICTLADWKVSHRYAPYRPDWDLVSTLFPTSYVAPAVNSNVSSKLSIICGGYAKIGKLVNINMRLVVTDTIPVGNQLFYGLPTINIDAGSLSVGAAVGGCYFQHISTGDTGTDTTGAITYEGTTALSALVLPFASEPLKAGTYIVTGTYLSA